MLSENKNLLKQLRMGHVTVDTPKGENTMKGTKAF
jgi:hypothetical protein